VIEKSTPLGFQKASEETVHNKIKENVLTELKKTFNPEFLNRVDEIVVFHPLEKEHLHAIIDLLVDEVNRQLLERELSIELDEEVKQWLVERYFQPSYGARPMRRAIQREIEDPLAEEMLRGRFKGATRVRVVLEESRPAFVEVEDRELFTAGIN
ncbi:MAG: ATP-dependent Clp protease ATP-binding subunit ClpC, partial [Thermodesulfovibrionales bacterium]